MVGLSFRMFKGDRIRIRIRGILLWEMVLQAMGAHRIELGMPMHVKENRSSVIIDKMLLMQAQENGEVLDEEELLFLAGEQADECDAFDSDVDDESTAQSIFMANLSSVGNVIPYEKYLLVDNISVVPSCVSSALNDVCVSSDNYAFVPHDPIATELKIYKEQVAIYEQCAKFELTECQQRIDDQMRAQNPFYLRQAKKAQLALYDGEELLKTNNVPVIVQSSEEDLELAETSRNKLHAKMNDSACVEKRVNITPPNYSKENFMATFTPQTQLTPEQVFWAMDLEKRKAEKLKANALPLPILPPVIVYPPNTPVHLDFEKICKRRIIPTGITEGERGFEQTKRCYLTEVIPFFNLLKEQFDEVQKSLVTEVRAMKVVFENLEAEVDQNEIELKSGEIERKTLIITNENLIIECLSKDVFYTATDYVLNMSRFSDMHDAFTFAQKRIADLESKNFNLRNKIQNDDHDLMIKHFSKLEIQSRGNTIHELKEKLSRLTKKNSDADPTFDLKALVSQNKDLTAKLNALHDLNEHFRAENEKIKHHYKELYDSIKITCAKTTDQNNSLLSEIENLKAQLKDNSKCVTIPDCKPKVLAPGRYLIDVEPIPPRLKKNQEVHLHYIERLKENVETLREIVEDANVERPLDTSLALACCYTKHSQELLEYVIGTCPKDFGPRNKQNASTNSLRKKRVTFVEPHETSTQTTTTTRKLFTTIGHQWRPTGRILPLGDQWPLTRNTPPKVVQIVLWYLDSGCSKHMTGDRSRLRNFMKKFIGTVRFGNDHFGAIMGYGDYVIDLEVAFRKHTCFVRDLDGVDLIKGSRGTNLYTISVEDMMRSSPICLLSKASKNKSWLWHRRLNHLNFGTLNDLARKDLVRGLPRLKFEKDHLCSACQLGKSRKATHKPKTINTIMEVLHTLHMDLCGPLRVQSINGKKYILVIVRRYSRFTWVKFLRSKDETPHFCNQSVKTTSSQSQQNCLGFVRTDNGTEYRYKDLIDFYEA
ncbi:retrovirus-related pol polyprotein from transposon TNT 1-94 [Tanacetum coccineum]